MNNYVVVLVELLTCCFYLVWVFCDFDCFGLCVDCILEIGFGGIASFG